MSMALVCGFRSVYKRSLYLNVRYDVTDLILHLHCRDT